MAIRTALLGNQWGQLAGVLAGLSSEVHELDEARAACEELSQMRDAVEAELKEALLTGRSVKVVASKKVVMMN